MIIVVEGPDLSGKSTLANNLAISLGYKLIKWPYSSKILEKCPDESGETFLKTIEQFKDVDIVLDRGFISNIVYCDLYERNYDNSYIYELVKKLDVMFIQLNPSEEVMTTRYINKGDELVDSNDLSKLKSLYEQHSDGLRCCHDWDVRTIYIDDINYNPLEETLKTIKMTKTQAKLLESIKRTGKESWVWSNYHNEYTNTLEIIGANRWLPSEEFESLEPVKDSDYGDMTDKINKVVDKLNNRETDRGAIIINPNAEDGDCVCLWQFFIRNNTLITITYLRSSDIIRKFDVDVKMARWLTEQIKSKLRYDLKIGQMLLVQGSAHIYID